MTRRAFTQPIEWHRDGCALRGTRDGELVAEVLVASPTSCSAWVRSENGGMRTANPARPWHQSVWDAERACRDALQAC